MRLSRGNSWTAAQDALLRACVGAAKSFAQAADEINRQFGTSLTRNSTISRAARIGLRAVNAPGWQHETQHTRAAGVNPIPALARQPVRDRITARPAGRAPVGGVPFLDLQPWHCRAILDKRGRNGLALFCGAANDGRSSYCAAHHARFLQRPRGGSR